MGDSLVFNLLGNDYLSDKFDKAAHSGKSLEERLDSLGKTGLKSLGALTGASLAGGAAVGAALGGAAVAIGAAGILLTATNEDIAQSFSDLGTDAVANLKRSAAPLTPYTEQIVTGMRTTFGQVQPLIDQAFRSSGPQVLTFSRGINQLALNAMPGLVTATNRSSASVDGMAEMMATSGTAVSGFFTNLSSHSEAGGRTFVVLGNIVNTVLPAAGRLLGQLADVAAEHGDDIEDAVSGVITTVENLGGGALPVLSTALGMSLDVVNGLVTALGPMSGMLGGVVGVALSVAAALKLANAAGTTLGRVDSTVGNFVNRMKEGTAGATTFGGKVAALASAGIGPLGAVVGVATVGLMLLGSAQESTARKTQQHSTYVQALTSSLRDSAGAIDASTRKTVANDEGVKGAIDSAKQFGISSATVVDAVIGQGDALDNLRPKLRAIMEANKEARFDEHGQQIGWTGAYIGAGAAAQTLLKDIEALNGKTGEAKEAASLFGQAMQASGQSMLTTTSAGLRLTSAVGVLRDKTADADTRARALKDALDALSGDSLTLAESQSRVNAQLIQLRDLAGSSTDRTKGWGDALVDANGSINTLLPNGQALFTNLSGLRDNITETAQKTFDLSQAMGDSVPVSMEKAKSSVAGSREKILGLARDLGISEARAKELLATFDIAPDRVAIAIQTPGMSESQRELAVLFGRVTDIPGTKSITVNSLTEESVRKLGDLGYRVTHLPEGRVRIESNTDPAWSTLNGFLNAKVSKQIPVSYYGINTPGSLTGPNRPVATGAVFLPMAIGGINAAKPMSGGVAEVIQPGVHRIIGDNVHVPEAFIPLDDSSRSHDILTVAARAMGRLGNDGASAGAVIVSGGGGGQVVNYYVTFPNITDGAGVRKALLELKRELGGGDLGIA